MLDFGDYAALFGPDPLVVVRTALDALVHGIAAGAIAVALTVVYGRR